MSEDKAQEKGRLPCGSRPFLTMPYNKIRAASYTVSMKILFTGGGSAGHVVPNLALMHELRYTYALIYMGTGGIEEKLVTEAGYPFLRVDCPKLRRSFTLENFKIPCRLHRAKKQALAAVRAEKPDLVFSKGGFVSYPAVWAAARLGIPVLTHESDLTPGLCTKLIAKKCERVLTSFEETARLFPNGEYVGSPVRKELFAGEKQRALHKLSLPPNKPVLLVFGGGSGSHVLNEALKNALDDLLTDFTVYHIAGADAEHCEKREGYFVRAFETDMASAYAAADVVLSRAGSNTVFELMALKKRAVLVPLERGSRGDQPENAAYFERKGLVRVLPERALGGLAEAVRAAYRDKALGENLASLALTSGTGEIVRIIREVLAQGGASE